LNGTDAFALLFRDELVCVAMATSEGEGHAPTDHVIVAPSGDWNTTRSWVLRQSAHTYTEHTVLLPAIYTCMPTCNIDRCIVPRDHDALWPAQSYGTFYQQQFVKQTACIRLSVSSNSSVYFTL